MAAARPAAASRPTAASRALPAQRPPHAPGPLPARSRLPQPPPPGGLCVRHGQGPKWLRRDVRAGSEQRKECFYSELV